MYLPKNILPDFFNLTFNQAFDISFSDSIDHNATAETFFEPPSFTRKHGHRQRLGFRICQEPFNLLDATVHSRITLCHNTYLLCHECDVLDVLLLKANIIILQKSTYVNRF